MINLNFKFVLVLLLIGYLWVSQIQSQTQRGGSNNAIFSSVKDDISNGNSISWSKIVNRPGKLYGRRPIYNKEKLTFQGHGIPLIYETRLSKTHPSEGKSLSSRNLKCHPGCCPSTYSCDGGCLCFHRSRQAYY